MKRKFNYLIALALMAFTFTSCEDVPSPFGEVVPPKGDDVVVIDPSGTGTEADPFNIAGVIEYVSGLGADVASPNEVYFKGYITSITEAYGTQYGNATFEVSDTKDGGNKFLCYRVKYFDGQSYSNPSDPNIKEGNEVIMCGKVVNYKGNTPETSANAAWLYSLNGTKGGGSTPAAETIGTKDAPITVAKALEYINKLEDNGTTKEDAYVTGKITKIKTADDKIATYKNIDYVISDGTNELTVFRGKNIDNTDFTAPGQINVGDEVVVLGKLTKYVNNGNVTPEVAQGNYIVKLTKGGTPSGGDAKGTGTLADPYNAAGVIKYIATLGADVESPNDVYIKGKLVKYANNGEFNTQYGNASFYISDDGSESGEQFYVFRTLYLGNVKYTEGVTPEVGNEVVICGKVINYKGNTPETSANKSYIYSLNGNTGGGGGGDTGGAKGTGTQNDPFNVAAAIAKCQEVGQTASTEKYYIKGIADAEYTVNSYKNVEVDIVDTEGSSDKFKVFRVKDKDGKGIKEGYKIPKGATIIVYGPVVNYKGNTPETATGAYLVSVNGQAPEVDGDSGGGSQGGGGETSSTLTNGDFETWANGQPTGWKSASTASSATLEQSTDAHSGSYACIVKGDEGNNKRLASQEIKLAAGTYNLSFWVKPTTSDVAQVRPGYVPVTDGKAGSYAYGDYATLSAGWQQVSYEFTLTAETTICVVVMNPKKSNYSSGKDVLIDDATLTKK